MKTIQLVIPMAGEGTRFSKRGYTKSKPLLPIGAARMIEVVLGNLMTDQIARVILVARRDFKLRSEIDTFSSTVDFQVDLVEIDETTDGPASTVELALGLLDPEKPLVIANSDQYLDFQFTHFYALVGSGIGGAILTMEDQDPKWSYAMLNEGGDVEKVVEKKVISNFATAGIYGFGKTRYFFESVERMHLAADRTNGEYYVGPVYNYFDPAYGPIRHVSMGPVGQVMYGLGIPEDYEAFLKSTLVHKAESEALIFQHD
jgi:NDP-sugar pyrophosphorylase family protein